IYLVRAADVTVYASNGSTAQGGGIGVTTSTRVLIDDNDGWFSEFGIWVNGSTSVAVSNNRLHRNWRGVFVTTSPSLSISDNAVGGNYWSDYGGVDHCRGPAQDDCSAADGIGDTPYLVASVIRDRYPRIPFDLPPFASIAASRQSAFPHASITFTAVVRDPHGTVTSYAWNFGDGSTGVGAVVDHAFAATGTYSVRLL